MTLLNRQQCTALRGIAIFGIFMHNYLHWLGPMVKENEYQFFQGNVDRMMAELASFNLQTLIFNLFSFFGHYGVPVFLFLSGYGLVKKYETATNPSGKSVGVMEFISHHFKKLFPMMLLGFVVFAMIDWMTPGHHRWKWIYLLTQLTMTINVLPSPERTIWPGPYWFFGLIMQLYIVYRLLLYKRHWSWTVSLIVLCTALQALCCNQPEGDLLNYLRYNCIGGMLPFGIGLLTARFEEKIPQPRACVLLLAVAGVLVLSLNFWGWLLVPAFIVISNVELVRLLPSRFLLPLEWLGTLSAAIFVAHPVTRKIFIPISRQGDILDGLLLYIVATILLSMLYQIVIKKLAH